MRFLVQRVFLLLLLPTQGSAGLCEAAPERHALSGLQLTLATLACDERASVSPAVALRCCDGQRLWRNHQPRPLRWKLLIGGTVFFGLTSAH